MKRFFASVLAVVVFAFPLTACGGGQQYDDRNCYGYEDVGSSLNGEAVIFASSREVARGGRSGGSFGRSSSFSRSSTSSRPAAPARPAAPPKPGVKPSTSTLPKSSRVPTRTYYPSRYHAPSYWHAPWPWYPVGYYPPHVNHVYYDDYCREFDD